jgi:hypothetical protein
MICAADSSPLFSLKSTLYVALELNGGLPAAGRVEVDQVNARVGNILAEDSEVVSEIKLVLFVHLTQSITQGGRVAHGLLLSAISEAAGSRIF